jgi:glycosyltransferase involved in cell wall biosynthesis
VQISGGAYTSDVDEDSLRQVRLALAICTYRREAFLQRNIDMLKKQIIDNPDSMLRGKVKIYISDNGNTLDTAKLNSESITVYPNPNYGGAGGFTRSAIEAIEDTDFAPTHVILMDDDIQFDAEALERTFVFQRLIKPEYSSSMSSTMKRLLMARLTVICRGVPFMAYMSLRFTMTAL